MNIWLIMIIIGGLTFSLRASFILTSGQVKMPVLFERGLRYVPAAVLSAIIFPAILVQDTAVQIDIGNERLLAGCLAAVVAGTTRNMLATITVGMLALWLLQYFGF